jgi:hypothetical protein
MAVDDLDDIAVRQSYRSSPAPVEGAGRLRRRAESSRHSSASSGSAARTSRDPFDPVRGAMAVDDSDDTAARRSCGSKSGAYRTTSGRARFI